MRFRNPFRFQHIVKVSRHSTVLNDSALDWLEEHVGNDPDHWTLRGNKDNFHFYFVRTNDALMFKLAWGGK